VIASKAGELIEQESDSIASKVGELDERAPPKLFCNEESRVNRIESG